MAAGDRPAGKSLPRACAPFGYVDHLQIQDSGSRGDGIMLVSSHDLDGHDQEEMDLGRGVPLAEEMRC